MKTIFCDIDGTLLSHQGTLSCISEEQKVLPGVHEKFDEWSFKNYTIILTTARPESMREMTIKQLRENKIEYDLLIMGLPTGPRVVLNDISSHGENRAIGINLVRDSGLGDIEI